MTTILAFLFVIGIPIFLHELGHYTAARLTGMRVEKFYVGFNLFGLGIKKKINGTEYGLGIFPLGGYVKISGMVDESLDPTSTGAEYEFQSKNTFQKLFFLSAGVMMNFLLTIFIVASLTLINGIGELDNRPLLGQVMPESPADQIGLVEGDMILEINQQSVSTWTEMTDIIQQHPIEEISILWEHEGQELFGTVLTDSTRQLIDGNVKLVGMLGIGATINMKEASLSESLSAGVKRTYYWLKMMLDSLKALVTGGASFKDFVGPIFFAKVAGETAQNGLVSLLGLMALLSVNLGLINILPIPGLDGGHALLALVEGISRRKLPLNVKMGIQQIGVLFLLLLFVYIFVNDILRLF